PVLQAAAGLPAEEARGRTCRRAQHRAGDVVADRVTERGVPAGVVARLIVAAPAAWRRQRPGLWLSGPPPLRLGGPARLGLRSRDGPPRPWNSFAASRPTTPRRTGPRTRRSMRRRCASPWPSCSAN